MMSLRDFMIHRCRLHVYMKSEARVYEWREYGGVFSFLALGPQRTAPNCRPGGRSKGKVAVASAARNDWLGMGVDAAVNVQAPLG